MEYKLHVVHRLCVTLWIEKFFYGKIASDLRKHSSQAVDPRKIWAELIHRGRIPLGHPYAENHAKHAEIVMHLTDGGALI